MLDILEDFLHDFQDPSGLLPPAEEDDPRSEGRQAGDGVPLAGDQGSASGTIGTDWTARAVPCRLAGDAAGQHALPSNESRSTASQQGVAARCSCLAAGGQQALAAAPKRAHNRGALETTRHAVP